MTNPTLCLLLLLLSCNVHTQSLSVEHTAEGVLVKQGEEKVLFYQKETKSKEGKYPRANYVHPLYGIDGAELTEDFPADHLHHRGIFWAWHQVIIGEKNIGDTWECKDFEWDVLTLGHQQENKGALSLHTQVLWKSPLYTTVQGGKKPFLKEETKITVHPKTKNHRVIDFEISLLALVPDLKLGGSDDQKGYGGFSVRMKMPEDIRFVSKEGEIVPSAGQVNAGQWVNISGSLAANSGKAGMVIMRYPNHPLHPQPWILRKSGSMQNPVYPGRIPVSISDKKPTILKYRLVVYKGLLSENEINRIYAGQH